jgi:hypothetical protein
VWQGGTVEPGGYAPVIVTTREKGRHLVPRQWGVPPPPRGEHLVLSCATWTARSGSARCGTRSSAALFP